MNYRVGGKEFIKRDEHFFHTQRRSVSTFTFVVEADPHMDENTDPGIYREALMNMGADKPDFIIDLGDTCMSNKLENITYGNIEDRALLLRSYFDIICHSVPLFLVLGNHDGETGWTDGRSGAQLAVWNEKARLLYYLNPSPNKFYSGNPSGKGNYYAFTWGDALFVMIDPYRYTTEKPRRRNSDNWGWTLGKKQYMWLKETLEKSKSKYKFFFGHQLVGGDAQGRGGAEFASFYEWGGLNQDDSYGFADKRPGWDKPIHQLFVDTGVDIYFHGHDHFFARQEMDGIIYQLVPQPSCRNTNEPGHALEYGYRKGIIQGNSGYLRIKVTPDGIKVEYNRTAFNNRLTGERHWSISYSYILQPDEM